MKNIIVGTQQTIPRARELRRNLTGTEKILWRKLRAKKFFGCKFRRQVAIGPYITDFLCVEKKIVVEVDGYVHEYKKERDQQRECYLRAQGFRILRINNRAILDNLEGALETIMEFLSTPLPDPLPKGEGNSHS